jgi:hypothetical protein
MKLLSKVLSTAVVGATLMTAGYASATTTTIALDGSPTLKTDSGTTFNDVFSFTLASMADVTIGGSSSAFSIDLGSLGSFAIPASSFTGGKLSSANGGWFSVSSTDFNIGDNSFSFAATGLAAGDYLFTLKGKTNGSYGVGAYGLAAVAVPEPGEWAMMLAGLGMIGAMVRRRITK